jgi:hypothetical protein
LYRCNNNGSMVLSDKPCPGASTRLTAIGPDPYADAARSNTYIPPVGKAPEHLPYLSPECASLNDAIRTGPARGLRSQTLSDLHSEYQQKCAEEDQAARQRLWQEKSAQRQERRSQEQAQQAAQARATTSREQCSELLRILHGKRKQLEGMTAGEKADLQRFEANYNERCRSS